MTSPAIGIDLGTTYSCVAVFQNGKVEIIANDQGNRTTPSYVAFTDSERLIGEVAKSQTIRNPQNTVFDVKRIIGRPFSDPAVTGELKRWPFKVVNDNNTPIIQVEYRNQPRRFRPEEISAMVLSKMKETAEACLGQVVTEAVITVPAYFNNQQRTATKDAARIAGLQVKRMINEPTAAALAYGLDKCTTGLKNVLVFDLGGGTIDVSILKITKGPSFDVLATSGDTHLGGQDFDNRMVKHFAEEFQRKHNQDISKSATAMQKLKVACEQAKRSLSTTTKAFIEIDSLFQGKHFNSEITRARFEKLCMDLFTRTLDCVEQALKDARMDKGTIDDVVLVGGSTRIPKVQKLLREFFDGKHLNKNVHPDEAVAYGAALQAAAVCSNSSEPPPKFILRDVLPLSIGVEVGGISMMRMVDRNTPIPVRRSNTFVLGRDNQDAAGVRVLEGERVLTAHCSIIGEFELSGLVPRRREEPGIKITFDVDADGILTVSAEDVRSDKAKSIVITDSAGRISESDVKRMIREAEVFRTEDVSLRERVAMKGDIEAFLLTARRRVEEAEGRVSVQDAELVFNTFSEVMNWLDRNKLAEKYELVSLKKDTEDKINPVLERIARSEGAGQSQASSHRGGVPHFAQGGYPQANRGGGTGRGTRPQEHFGRGDDDFLGPSLGGPRGTRGTRPQEHFGRGDDDFLGPSLGGPRGTRGTRPQEHFGRGDDDFLGPSFGGPRETRGTRPQEHFGRGDDDFLGPSLGGPRGTRGTRPQEHFGRGDDDFLGPSLGGLGSFGSRRSSVEPDEQPDAATAEERGPVADVMNELD